MRVTSCALAVFGGLLLPCAYAACGSAKTSNDVVLTDVLVSGDEFVHEAISDASETAGEGLGLDGETDGDSPEADSATDAPPNTNDAGLRIEAPILLLEKEIANLDWGADQQFPLDASSLNPWVRISECDTIGVMFRDVVKSADGTFDTAIIAQVFDATGDSPPPRGFLATSTRQAAPLPLAGTPIFSSKADGCKPRFWRVSDTRPGYDLWSPQPDGTYQAVETQMGLETALGKVPASIRHIAGDLDRKEQFHLLMEAGFQDGTSTPVHAWLKDGSWVVERWTYPQESETCRYAFATDGVVHTACRVGTDLVHGAFVAGAWAYDTAATSGSPDIVMEPSSIAMAGYEIPVIAFTRMQALEDAPLGTPQFAWTRLELATRVSANTWKLETLVTKGDGYQGQDGDSFTGFGPDVRIDSNGGTHIAFADIAAWHDPNGTQFLEPGQARYARRTASGFDFHTVFNQRFEPKKDPLRTLGYQPMLAVSPGGKRAAFLVLERYRNPSVAPVGTGIARLRLQLVRTSR